MWAGRPPTEADWVIGRECMEPSGTLAVDWDRDFGGEVRVGWRRGGKSVNLTRGQRKRRVFGGRLLEGHAVVDVVGMGLLCLSNKFDRSGRLKYVLVFSRTAQGVDRPLIYCIYSAQPHFGCD